MTYALLKDKREHVTAALRRADSRDGRRQTPLLAAIEYNNVDTALLLVESGAPLDAVDARGYDALMLSTLRHSVALVRRLLDARVTTSRRTPAGDTALTLALAGRHAVGADDDAAATIVQLLRAAGAAGEDRIEHDEL